MAASPALPTNLSHEQRPGMAVVKPHEKASILGMQLPLLAYLDELSLVAGEKHLQILLRYIPHQDPARSYEHLPSTVRDRHQ